MSEHPTPRGVSGHKVVVVLILLGVLAGIVSVSYWATVARLSHGGVAGVEGAGGAAGRGDATGASADALEAIGNQFADALEAHRSTEAIAHAATDLVLEHPNDPAARNLLANILVQRNHWEDAYQQMRISLELNPDQPEVQLNAGTAAMHLHKYGLAGKHYSQAVGLDQRNARYRVHLAHAYIAQKRFDEARKLLLEALRADSTMHEAYQGMSELYAKQHHLTLAIEQITKAIENTPAAQRHRQVDYIREKAKLLRRNNQPEEALITLRSLLAQERRLPGVMSDLAVTYAMLGKPGQAAELYEQVMVDDPTDIRWPLEAARWRLKAGDKPKAREDLNRAREINPADPKLKELETEVAGN